MNAGSRATHTAMPSACKQEHGDRLAACHRALRRVTRARQAAAAHPASVRGEAASHQDLRRETRP
eukprot:9940478-Alexandrium_andersonii.AAC.1